MEVVEALSIPVFASIDGGLLLPSEISRQQKWDGSAEEARIGAMNLYFFR
jgi:hypothetical protein